MAKRLGIWVCARLIPPGTEFGPARGWFSIAEQVRNRERPGRIILERHPDPHPHGLVLRRAARLGQEQQHPWPVFWSQHREATLIGPSLLVRDRRKRVGVEGGFGRHAIRDDPAFRQFRHGSPVRLSGNWTSVKSRWVGGNFYHWFMEALPRLACLAEFPPDTGVLVPATLTGFQRETLEWLGLTNRMRLTPEDHLQVENYFFSSLTNMTGLFDPCAVSFLRRSLLERRDKEYQPPTRFFVHRVNSVRGLVNESEVLRFFASRGWAIVDLAALPLARQMQLFANAEEVCALHGAALTHLLWASPQCRVLELLASNYLNGVYEGLAEAVGAQHRFLICPGDADHRALVDLQRLAAALDPGNGRKHT